MDSSQWETADGERVRLSTQVWGETAQVNAGVRPARSTSVYGQFPVDSFAVKSRPFQKLSDRARGLAYVQILHEGVPNHLVTPLRLWIYNALGGGGAELVALHLQISIDYERAGGNGAMFLSEDPQPSELLDIVDAILRCGGPWPAPSNRYSAEQTRRGNDASELDADSQRRLVGVAGEQRSRRLGAPRRCNRN